MQNANKVPEVTVVLNDLVSDPFALLNGLGSCTQCHKVTLDDVLSVLGVEPQRKRPRKMIG